MLFFLWYFFWSILVNGKLVCLDSKQIILIASSLPLWNDVVSFFNHSTHSHILLTLHCPKDFLCFYFQLQFKFHDFLPSLRLGKIACGFSILLQNCQIPFKYMTKSCSLYLKNLMMASSLPIFWKVILHLPSGIISTSNVFSELIPTKMSKNLDLLLPSKISTNHGNRTEKICRTVF